MSQFLAEKDLEDAAIGWLLEFPQYRHQYGPDIKRPFSKAVLEDRFEAFLARRYPHVPARIRADSAGCGSSPSNGSRSPQRTQTRVPG